MRVPGGDGPRMAAMAAPRWRPVRSPWPAVWAAFATPRLWSSTARRRWRPTVGPPPPPPPTSAAAAAAAAAAAKARAAAAADGGRRRHSGRRRRRRQQWRRAPTNPCTAGRGGAGGAGGAGAIMDPAASATATETALPPGVKDRRAGWEGGEGRGRRHCVGVKVGGGCSAATRLFSRRYVRTVCMYTVRAYIRMSHSVHLIGWLFGTVHSPSWDRTCGSERVDLIG